ncbi:hypothetical protein IscW_ISCW012640 [Ixodes scapularis]|uniref:Uncharacterized protein n=1 Tax=Ixodes scapularis TaxID=6945 RepID=B7QB07_IXOSC|nr:hypothetical protein IscW_ISCW012640 [Ixodes scapularis]|eukprot:XP_002412733.1 hypothetical protein IscW_ISCW012640 [Ixodes scapularis]
MLQTHQPVLFGLSSLLVGFSVLLLVSGLLFITIRALGVSRGHHLLNVTDAYKKQFWRLFKLQVFCIGGLG